jgi:hypothetical protein
MDLHMITTTDNPYSPVTDYVNWLTWDERHGYHSNSLLARVVYSSPELSDLDRIQAIEDGIDEIVTENVSGVHTKVRAGSVVSSLDELHSDSDSAERSAA